MASSTTSASKESAVTQPPQQPHPQQQPYQPQQYPPQPYPQQQYQQAPYPQQPYPQQVNVQQVNLQGSQRAVTRSRKRTSHGLHLFLTIITGGAWGLVWIWMTLWHKFGPRKRAVTRYR